MNTVKMKIRNRGQFRTLVRNGFVKVNDNVHIFYDNFAIRLSHQHPELNSIRIQRKDIDWDNIHSEILQKTGIAVSAEMYKYTNKNKTEVFWTSTEIDDPDWVQLDAGWRINPSAKDLI